MICRSSQISEFKACAASAYYRYDLGLSPTGGKPDPHLFFGRVLHKAVDILHKEDVYSALDFLERTEWTDSRTKTKARAKSLLKIYATNNKVVLVDTEREFSFRIGKHTWRGRWDGAGVYGRGFWIVEHKTTKAPYLIVKPNDQIIAYWAGGRKVYGEKLQGVIVNQFDVERLQVYTFPVTFTVDEYLAWRKEILLVLDYYERCRETAFPMSTSACYRYHKPCAYMPICMAEQSTKKVIMDRCYTVSQEVKNLAW